MRMATPRLSALTSCLTAAARDILREAVPHGTAERRLAIALAVWWAALVALRLAFSDPRLSLMGFDTGYNLTDCLNCTHIRDWYLRHPLLCLFYSPFSLLSKPFGGDSFAYICYALNVVWLTLGSLCVFKLLRRWGAAAGAAALSTALFCSLAYVLLLAWQIDSYTLNLFLLPLSLLVVAAPRHAGKPPRSTCAADNILFLLLAGATLTNGAKLLLAFFAVERSPRRALRRAVKATPLLLVSISWYVPLIIYRIVFKHTGVVATLMNDSTKWSQPLFTLTGRAEAFFSNFLAEPVLFHFQSLAAVRERIIMPFYGSPMPYLLLAAIALAVALSLWANRRHVCVRLFAAYFAIDVLICFGFGFGVDEANIYAPHYLFFIPLLTGLLSIRNNRGGLLSVRHPNPRFHYNSARALA